MASVLGQPMSLCIDRWSTDFADGINYLHVLDMLLKDLELTLGVNLILDRLKVFKMSLF